MERLGILLIQHRNSKACSGIYQPAAETMLDLFSKDAEHICIASSTADVLFERITLSANGFVAAHFYCKCVSNNPINLSEMLHLLLTNYFLTELQIKSMLNYKL